MKKIVITAAIVAAATTFTSPLAHADETWLALVVNSTNSKNLTSAFWNTAPTAEAGWAMGMKDCQARYGSDGTCEQPASSRRCIGLVIAGGTKYEFAYADTAEQAYKAAQARSSIPNASGTGHCADGTKTGT